MNGLANAILTLLLGWLRVIINRFWSLVNSDTGTSFQHFLSKHWLTILVVLLVGGYLLDRIIYLIRWQPFQVWLRRRRGKKQQEEPIVSRFEPVEDLYPAQAEEPYYDQPYDAPADPPYRESTAVYHPRPAAGAEQTAVYAHSGIKRSAYLPPIENVDPIFDEEQTPWAEADPLVSAPEHTRAAVPVTHEYMKDVQAGFARPVQPEKLYTPIPQEPVYSVPAPGSQPVHPGLDADALRRSMGLNQPQEQTVPHDLPDAAEEVRQEPPLATDFTPFTQKDPQQSEQKKSRNPFMNLMRLVGEDSSRPSINDLQKTVDVRTAFHDPVFPRQPGHDEEA